MKVLQVLPELHSGGVERGTLELAKHLVEQGHSSLVISNGGRLVDQLIAEGSQHFTLPVHKKSLRSLGQIPILRRFLAEHRPDILHLRSRVPAWLCSLAWKKLPASTRPHLVTTVHGFYSVSPYSAIMTKGERVICVSDSVRQYVLKNYPKVSPGKLTVIHRGIEPEAYHPAFQPPPEWLAKWQQEQPQLIGKTLLTLPGRITRWKGQEDFLEVLSDVRATHPHIHGLIVGGPHERKRGFWEELQAEARSRHLTSHLTFLGHRSDLREILSVSDLVYSLSRDPEAFGRVSLEALALGKPVLAYHHGGVAEQLDALFPNGAIEPLAIPQVIARTRELLDSPSPPQPQPNQLFTLPQMVSATVQIYEDLLAKTPS